MKTLISRLGRPSRVGFAFAGALTLAGCTTHTVHIKTEPIHLTVDVNLKADLVVTQYLSELNRQREALQEAPGS